VTLTMVTPSGSLGPGTHTFGLACNEDVDDIVYNLTYLSVMVAGPG
jgi:hypothetical protein